MQSPVRKIPTLNNPEQLVLECGAIVMVRAATRLEKAAIVESGERPGSGDVTNMLKMTEAAVRWGVVELRAGANSEQLFDPTTGNPVVFKRDREKEFPKLDRLACASFYNAITDGDVKRIDEIVTQTGSQDSGVLVGAGSAPGGGGSAEGESGPKA